MNGDALTIVALSAYHGGPRREFLEGLSSHSRHEYVHLTLPPRAWPWRLKGSALHFAAELGRLRRKPIDLILATDLVDTARLRALVPAPLRGVPIVQYFHDDVLSAELKDRPRDEPLALAQLYSLLTSDLVLVASEHHREALARGARRLLATFPEAVPSGAAAAVERSLRVMPPGVEAAAIRETPPRAKPPGPPVILWNHPWSEDQNPRMFFETLYHLEQEGVAFRLIAVGIAVRKYPEVFAEARRRLARHILQFGYVPGRQEYLATIRAADIVVSTATREWFPLGVVEAVVAGACPVVGRGLAGGEVFGDRLAAHSYRGPVDLRRRLARLLANPRELAAAAETRDRVAARYDWVRVARDFDALLARAAAGGRARTS